MNYNVCLTAIIAFAFGALAAEVLDDPMLRGCLPVDPQRPVVSHATSELACAHWTSIGQGWKCP
jgi:hypothetical protein